MSLMGHNIDGCDGTKHMLYVAGLMAGSVIFGYFIGMKMANRKARVNKSVKLTTDKVVDTFSIEDIGDKKAFCRCWRSNKWPLCDGTHNKHNEATGDNVGPLLVENKSK